jgi:hypothetical protein
LEIDGDYSKLEVRASFSAFEGKLQAGKEELFIE